MANTLTPPVIESAEASRDSSAGKSVIKKTDTRRRIPQHLAQSCVSRLAVNPQGSKKTAQSSRSYKLSAAFFILAAIITPILCVTSNSPVYSAIAGAVVMLAVNLLIPTCRPDRPYLSPYNWALTLFTMELIIVPASIMLSGAQKATLPSLPSALSIERAYLLTVLGYISFSLSYWVTSKKQQHKTSTTRNWGLSNSAAFFYVVLGCVGMVLVFSGTSIIDYYTRATRLVDPLATTTLAGAASTFLRPFLAFGVVAMWSRRVDAKTASQFSLLAAGLACACVTSLVFTSYDYNRATIAVPLVCLAAVMNRHVKKLPLVLVSCLGSALLLVLMFIGQYRATHLSVSDLLDGGTEANNLVTKIDLPEQLQLYSGGPQFTAYLLDVTEWGDSLFYGKTLLGSFMYTVPVFGKTFRPDSGVTLYNNMIYGNSTTIDQAIPFTGELFINFHVAGIIFGYALLGYLIRRIQAGFEDTESSLKTFCLLYLAIWLCYTIHSSALVVSQMFLYFCPPIYGILLLMWLRRDHSMPAPSPARSTGTFGSGIGHKQLRRRAAHAIPQ